MWSQAHTAWYDYRTWDNDAKGFVMHRRFGILLLALAIGDAQAVQPFGFNFGMSSNAVEKAADSMGLGISKWFGKTLIVQAQDNQHHSYLFNFCNDKLYEVSQHFQFSFDQMASFVDATVGEYGQPMWVSAKSAMTPNGPLRPINLYWKIDGGASYVRLMQMPESFAIVYQAQNSCVKVPT